MQYLSENKIFEAEYIISRDDDASLPFEVFYDSKDKVYCIEGPRIEKMLGYTNIDSERGFTFFQNFMKDNGILAQLEELGIVDGDTVRIYGWEFDYYK